jgi:dienelactone hydrolase
MPRRALLAAALALAAAATAWPVGARADEEPPYEVLEFDWVDAARQRSVPVRLYLPRAASAARPVPLVVFSHGIGGSRRGYSYLGSSWASAGYASLHLQHVGSDRNLWQGQSSALTVIGRVRDALTETEAVARARDLRFALDQLLAGDLAPRLDAGRIVAAGHSFGANTTLLVAGARVERDGRPVELADPRIKAAIVISAPPFPGESAQRILGGVTVPSLHVTATGDVIHIPGYYSVPEDRVAMFEATGSRRKLLAVFEGGSHSMFTDRSATGGVTLNPQVKAATRELSLAFLRSVFDGDDAALQSWPGRFAAIVARFSAAP